LQYFISFLEGVVTFISPCLLPMLPVYVSYLAGGSGGGGRARTLGNALCFAAGFTVVFTVMGAFAGTLGMLLRRHQAVINAASGAVVIALGLNYLGVPPFGLFGARSGSRRARTRPVRETGPLFSMLFGMTFSISWTPCVGAFLGSALMMASNQGSAPRGIAMLLCYSAGLGIPFLISALLIERVKSAFSLIKRNYWVINAASGAFLIVIGALMATGMFGRVLPRLMPLSARLL
jgi:cytochrome c-type biogenesis protein